MIRSLLQPKQHIVSNTFINILFQSIRSDLLGVDEDFARNAIAQVSSSFLMQKNDQRRRAAIFDQWPGDTGEEFPDSIRAFLGRSSQFILLGSESEFKSHFGSHWVAFRVGCSEAQ